LRAEIDDLQQWTRKEPELHPDENIVPQSTSREGVDPWMATQDDSCQKHEVFKELRPELEEAGEPKSTSTLCGSHKDSPQRTSSKAILRMALDKMPISPHSPSSPRSRTLCQCKRMATFLESAEFEMAVGVIILLNTTIMAFEMQYLGITAGHASGYKGYYRTGEEAWPHAGSVFTVLDRIFTAIFTVELTIRATVLRTRYLSRPANWLDILVVATGLLDWIAQEYSRVDATMVRLLRLLKLGRGLRVLRVSKVLASLHLLLKCVGSSVATLFWSLCLLGVIQCIAAMITGQLVRPYLMDTDIDPVQRQLVFSYYGTFTRSVLTMFEITLANWGPPCRVLVDNVSELYSGLFLIYRCLVGFAVLNVISAVFIQQTLKVAQADNDVMIMQKQKAQEDYTRKLRQLFDVVDVSGDGFISWEEFSNMLSRPSLKAWMAALEIESHDMEELFQLMDHGDGQISVDQFTLGALRIKGQAKGIDMVQLMAQTQRVEAKIDGLQAALLNSGTTRCRAKKGTDKICTKGEENGECNDRTSGVDKIDGSVLTTFSVARDGLFFRI